MAAQLLYEAAGRPAVSGACPFSDVSGEYSSAVTWAAEEGCLSGAGDGTFAPDRPVTRQEFAAILWRQAGSPDTAAQGLSQFRDAGSVAEWAREPVLWCTTPENYFMLDHLAYRCLVYDCHQEWDDLPLDWESDLTAAADVVFAASPGLRQRLLPCSDTIALLPNGANPQMFLRDGLEPPELVRQLPRPVFARVGDVSADLELAPLVHTAQRRPQWTFLLLGRVGQHALQVLSPLPNVTLAGPVPAVELPDYLSGCQVLFDLVRSRRRGSDVVPGRIYEYLSTGKPIVTMLPPEQTEFFPDAIYAAFDPNGFLRRCQLALDEDDSAIRDRRIHYAQDASWSRRAREIARILADTGLF